MTYKLQSGSRVAVIGGGPAGSLFSFFLPATVVQRCIDSYVMHKLI
jgi:NADPH-dependent glutamate synthase beta subunit-like oxidoreductase